MLKITERKGTKNLYLRGTVRAQPVYESTGTSDQKIAEEIRIKREAELLERSVHGAGATATFLEAAVLYLENGGEGRYLGKFDVDTNSWTGLIGHFGSKPLSRIDQAAIDEAAKLLKPDVFDATRNRQIYTPIAAILHFAALRDLCEHRKIVRPKPPKGRIRWLELNDRERLIGACSPHMAAIVIFMFDTGARVAETIYLDWADVNLQQKTVNFRDTKNGEDRTVPLTNRVFAMLANGDRREGRVFLTDEAKPYAKRQGGGGQLTTGFNAACRRAGINDFHPHDCRHTWATHFYRATKDMNALMLLGGWKSYKMVERYVHMNVDDLRDAVAEFDASNRRAKSVHPENIKELIA